MRRRRLCSFDQAHLCARHHAKVAPKLQDYEEVVQTANREGYTPHVTVCQLLAELAVNDVMALREDMPEPYQTCASCILNTLIDDTIPGILGEK